jgi:hypothetical protein
MVESNKNQTTQTVQRTNIENWDGTGFNSEQQSGSSKVNQDEFIQEVRQNHLWRKQDHEVPKDWDKNNGGVARDFSDDIGPIHKVADSDTFAEVHHLAKELPSAKKSQKQE